ncbi:hypothetical protein ACU4GD_34040 [Cupriavidus basilensis]
MNPHRPWAGPGTPVDDHLRGSRQLAPMFGVLPSPRQFGADFTTSCSGSGAAQVPDLVQYEVCADLLMRGSDRGTEWVTMPLTGMCSPRSRLPELPPR